MASVEPSRTQPDAFIDGPDLEPAQGEPAQLLLDLGDRPTLMAGQDIEDFGQVDRADPRWIGGVAEEGFDLGLCRLAGQGGDDGLRVEDGQDRVLRRESIADSSSRSNERSRSLVGPLPARDPIAAPIGSAGIGRIRMALPWSSRATRDVRHRCRISAGIEIWPPFEIVVVFMNRA